MADGIEGSSSATVAEAGNVVKKRGLKCRVIDLLLWVSSIDQVFSW